MGMLRLLLATTVMLSHYNVIEVSLATMAVCCFYIISGFYMQLLLSPPGVNVTNFYMSRALRIYPLYWTLTLATLLIQAPSELWQMADYHLIKLLYVLNVVSLFGHDILTLVQYDPVTAHFSPLLSLASPEAGHWMGYNLSVLGPAWSLSVELLFYAMAPLLLRLRTSWLCLVLVCSLCIKIVIASLGVYNSFWIDAFYPAELVFFLSGAVAFRIYQNMIARGEWPMAPSRTVSILACLGFCSALLVCGNNTQFITSHWFVIYFATTGATALILPFLFHATRLSSADRWAGNLSYPIYLSHQAVAQAMIGLLHVESAISIALTTFAASIALYTLIEKPIDKFRHTLFPIYGPAVLFVRHSAARSERLPKPVLPLGEALHGIVTSAEKGWNAYGTQAKQGEKTQTPVQAASAAARRAK